MSPAQSDSGTSEGKSLTGNPKSTKPITWREYSDWRQTKCPPAETRAPIWLDELDQAIHEFVGECAELSAKLQDHGPWALIPDADQDGNPRACIADEIGDVVFTATWVMDCLNPAILNEFGDVRPGFLPKARAEQLMAAHTEMMANLRPVHISDFSKAPKQIQSEMLAWFSDLKSAILDLQTHAGMLSNRFKKVRWQRYQPEGWSQQQTESAYYALLALCEICELTSISLYGCVQANMEKLDKRFPDGWKPGGGKR